MAGNTVLVTLAGDASSLTKTMSDVGSGASRMAADVDKAGSGVRGGFDNVAEGIDGSERKFRGLGDTIAGTGDIMQGFKDGNIVGVAMGFADLAGGITDFVVPALKAMGARIGTMIGLTTTATAVTEGETAAQAGLNAALLANPIGLVIAAIAALIGIGYLVIRNWDTIKDAFGAAWGWIKDRFGDLISFVSSLPSKIGSAASGMWDGIKNAFKAALNWVIDRWNGLEFKLPALDWGPFHLGGFTLGVPDIPKLHTGGRVPGVPGTEVPIMALAGETISRGGGAGAGLTIVVQGNVLDGRQLADLVHEALLRKQARTGALGIA